MTTQRFALNEEPHEAEVGSNTFLFKPEVYSDELLDAWAALRAITIQRDKPDDTAEQIAERTKAVNAATRQFIAELMLDDAGVGDYRGEAKNPAGASTFLATKLPDRVLLEMQRWILGVYGLGRPTTPSSDSSEPSSTGTPGDGSTGTGSSEA